MRKFQSTPALGGGCNSERSILTPASSLRFQSTPALGGGCNGGTRVSSRSASACFNPHPPLGAGATHDASVPIAVRVAVSIHTRPWGRVQRASQKLTIIDSLAFQSTPALGGGCNDFLGALTARLKGYVSIHTRPWGRVQLDSIAVREVGDLRFNPHPPLGAGATGVCVILFMPTDSVSIHTRPWGRVQRGV